MNYKLAFGIFIILLIGVFYFSNVSITGKIIGDRIKIEEFADYSENSYTSKEVIVVPIKVHSIRDSSRLYNSFRDKQNIREVFDNANRIWSGAGIYFQIEEIVISEVSFEAIPSAINGNYLELYNHENYDSNKINVFFTQSLNGINGLALVNINSVLVADFTTVNDFRTTAHELGHILGLGHVNPENRLMARGKNGELLIEEEILITRENAVRFSVLT